MSPLKSLFLSPPSFEGFDGGAGSRYQARREIRSFWYPTWLAQPAALIPGCKLIDAPPAGIDFETALSAAQEYDLVIAHTSTPSLGSDIRFVKALKKRKGTDFEKGQKAEQPDGESGALIKPLHSISQRSEEDPGR